MSTPPDDSTKPRGDVERATATAGVKVVRSDDLLGATGELLILHAGDLYRLRVTKRGKLILTK